MTLETTGSRKFGFSRASSIMPGYKHIRSRNMIYIKYRHIVCLLCAIIRLTGMRHVLFGPRSGGCNFRITLDPAGQRIRARKERTGRNRLR